MIKAAIAVVPHPTQDLFLGTTRKNNFNDWGFPGGKREMFQNGLMEDPLKTAIRETLEEARFNLLLFAEPGIELYIGEDSTEITVAAYLFRIKREYTGLILHPSNLINKKNVYLPNEGRFGWVSREELLAGSFGTYNQKVLDLFRRKENVS